MKEYLAALVRASPTLMHGRSVAREYLQARVLACLQRAGAMVPLALRILYASDRYSEGLDFVLERDRSQYDFRAYLRAIQNQLTVEAYAIDLKVNDRKVVHSAFVRFAGLLHELGLSPHREKVLSVKIEVDTNPPVGAVLERTVIRRHVTLHLQHHDPSSLLAGKLHAILQRPYLKGRDVYDLLWYLGDPDWPAPNLTLLNNALRQTGWDGRPVTESNWREAVRNRLQTMAWDRVVADVRPFLEPSANLDLLTLENVLRVLG